MWGVRLAPRVRLWLTFGTTTVLVVLALLALFLGRPFGGPRVLPEGGEGRTQQFKLPASGFHPGQSPTVLVPSAGWKSGVRVNSAPVAASNLPVLAFSGGLALALGGAVPLLARQRRAVRLPVLSRRLNRSRRAATSVLMI